MANRIFLFVSIRVRPEYFEKILSKLKAHILIIQGEPGCEFIEIYRDTQDSNLINVWEIWRDRASWDAHMNNSNSRAWHETSKELIESENIKVMKTF